MTQARRDSALTACTSLAASRTRLVSRMVKHMVKPAAAGRHRVVEFCHVVMGPTCGLVLADLGAEVIKVEPLDGDHTRKLDRVGRGLLSDLQPQQEELRRRPQVAARARSGAEADRERRRGDRELPARRDGQARLRLRRAHEGEAGADLLLAQGVSRRPVRASHGARRSGADDGRARLHDRRALRAAARRRIGQRRDGRHVRRDRDPRGGARAQGHRPRPVRAERALRELRVPRWGST